MRARIGVNVSVTGVKQSAKNAIKAGYGAVVRGSGLGRAWRAASGRRWGAAILNYHWIDGATFESHVRALQREFTIVELEQVFSYLDGRCELPAGAVAITFDDAYAAFRMDIYPIIQSADVPVTMFVPTNSIDSGETLWFNRLRAAVTAMPEGPVQIGSIEITVGTDRRAAYRAIMRGLHASSDPPDYAAIKDILASGPMDGDVLEKYRPMSWDDLRAMSEFVRIGAHTASHPNLARCTTAEIHREIVSSIERIRQELGLVTTRLAYPFGQPEQVNESVVSIARSAGVTHALTTISGRARRGIDRLRIPRYVCDDVPNGRILTALLGGLWPANRVAMSK